MMRAASRRRKSSRPALLLPIILAFSSLHCKDRQQPETAPRYKFDNTLPSYDDLVPGKKAIKPSRKPPERRIPSPQASEQGQRTSPDMSGIPSTYQEALDSLRSNGFGRAAEILEARVTQKKKMKLTREQARDAAAYLLQDLPGMKNARRLYGKMPRSTIELLRAVNERDVPREDAEEIAGYLLCFTGAMGFRNLRQLDSNHSHIIGREWHQIDYSGEGMTWQSQKKFGVSRGIHDFRKAIHIHRYFTFASGQPYFKRIYRPTRPFPEDFRTDCD